ncbi:MAG: LPS export ABC transporter ATP-binding protein [Chloroflexi bacterium]|nr:LPS export ABC transporter ATP-binding protein [Chloroflexota bacterium]
MRQIEARGLAKVYRRRKVVDGVDLEVNQGEVVGLLGPNGAGKTTTFYMIVGLIRPGGGQVFLDGHDVTRDPMYRRATKGLGYLPQEASIFRKLTVEENLMLVLQLRGLSAKEQKSRLEQLLDEFQIGDRRQSRGYELSGGERRRVEIARALASSPSFLLLDEPFTGIDPKQVEGIQQIIHKLTHDRIGILITDHAVRETLAITHRAYIMFEGQVKTHGTSAEIRNDPVARHYYLGERFE